MWEKLNQCMVSGEADLFSLGIITLVYPPLKLKSPTSFCQNAFISAMSFLCY